MCQAFGGLPVARREAPDVGVKQVGREVHPGANPGHLGGKERGIAGRCRIVVGAWTRGMARGMAAGEEAKSLRIHGALRSNRTCGEISDPIVGEKPSQVKSPSASG